MKLKSLQLEVGGGASLQSRVHRDWLGCPRLVGTAPGWPGRVLGGNSGRCSSDEDDRAFEVWQQLLVAGSQLVHRTPRQPESPHHTLWMGKVGSSAERTCPRSQAELYQELASSD